MSALSTVLARGLRSAQPAATTLPIGALYYVTDEHVIERGNGTTWDSFLDVMTGDSGSGGKKGLVPAPGVGDATKFLRGDGTYATAGGGSSPVLQATLALSHAQIQSLNSVPQTIVAAAGVGKIIMPVSATIHFFAAVGYNTSRQINLRFAGDTTDLMLVPTTTVLSIAASRYQAMTPALSAFSSATDVMSNKDLKLIMLGGDVTSGDPANTLFVSLVYFIGTLS